MEKNSAAQKGTMQTSEDARTLTVDYYIVVGMGHGAGAVVLGEQNQRDQFRLSQG